jgi:hypothetical protein
MIKILQQNIKREENNLINLEFKNKNNTKIEKTNLQISNNENFKNSTIEKLMNNIDSSNFFQNISEISKQDNNYIDRGVKTSIFESENNRNSKSHINENELIRKRLDNSNRIHKSKNRIEMNKFETLKNKINSNNILMKSDSTVKINSKLFYKLLNIFQILDKRENTYSYDSDNNKRSNSNTNENISFASNIKITRAKELGEILFQVTIFLFLIKIINLRLYYV